MEAPQQGPQHLPPPTASASHHSRICSVPLTLPSDNDLTSYYSRTVVKDKMLYSRVLYVPGDEILKQDPQSSA